MQHELGWNYVGLRVRDDVREKLEELARREEVTISHILRWAIREYLRKHFDSKDNGNG